MARFERLATLAHHRWSLPVLAELHRGRGAKFVTLVKRLGVSRDSLRRTLDALIFHGWVRRNAGYGHPMRPEYLLTGAGASVAPACAELVETLREMDLEAIGLRKWSLPVTRKLGGGDGRFNELKAGLPGVTARALTLALKGLREAGVVERSVLDGYPPASVYSLTSSGRRLVPLLSAI